MKTKSLNLLLLLTIVVAIVFSCKKQQQDVIASNEAEPINQKRTEQMTFPDVTLTVGQNYEFLTRSTTPSPEGIFDRAIKMTLLLDKSGTLNVDRKEIIVGEKAAAELPQVHFLTETTLKILGNNEQKVDHTNAHPQRDDIAYIPFSLGDTQPIFYRKSGELRAVCNCSSINVPPGQSGGSCTAEGQFCVVQGCFNCIVSFERIHQAFARQSVVVYTGPGSTIQNISINS